jgi:hypothetical protein
VEVCVNGLKSFLFQIAFGAFAPGIGGVDFDVVAIDPLSIQGFDCLISLGIARHLHKSESFRTPCKAVHDQFDGFDLSEFVKQAFYGTLFRVIGQIAYIDIHRKILSHSGEPLKAKQRYEALAAKIRE